MTEEPDHEAARVTAAEPSDLADGKTEEISSAGETKEGTAVLDLSPTVEASASRRRLYRAGRLWRMYRKELRETLRDRRTMITLLLMPLLLYPILSLALNRFLLSVNVPEAGYTVCVATEGELETLGLWLGDQRSRPPETILESRGGELAQFRLGLSSASSAEGAIKGNEADIGVRIEVTPAGENVVTIYAQRGDAVSESARQILVERLHWLSESEAKYFLRSQFPRYRPPLSMELKEVGEAKKPNLLATLIPLVLVLMTITGAVYPAIDLTAGERERGTLEAVMASPVPRFSVLLSKYFAVISVAFLTAIANLVAMFTTLWGSGLISMIQEGGGFPWILVLPMLGLLILFSLFFAALLLALTSFARSFKEAQAYLIPVMLVSLAPAMVSLVPGIELKGILVVVPLVNIVLLARDLLADEWVIDTAALAIGVTLLYAGSALAVAAKLFGGDAVMRTSEQSFKSLLRRPSRLANSPSFTQAAFVLAILVPCYFVVSNGLMLVLKQYGDVITVNWQLGLNGLSLALTFGLLPIVASWWNRCRFVTTYQIETPSLFAMVGAVLMGLGCWVFAHELFVFADAIGIGGLGDAQIQAAMAMIERMRQAPVWLLLLVFAVAPAVVEEVCFRGFFFTAIRGTLRPLWVITFTAMVFGLFHVLTGNALLVERFLPSTLMGLVIGWVAYKTGSIFPGMLIHFVHNALLNTVLYYADQLAFLGKGFDDQTHLPIQWIVLGAISVTTGAILVHLASKK